MLLQHFPSVDYVKKERRERGRDDAWEQDEFVSFKSIENDRSVCICASLLYHRTMPGYLTYIHVLVSSSSFLKKDTQNQDDIMSLTDLTKIMYNKIVYMKCRYL
jgi:hypothetical protein